MMQPMNDWFAKAVILAGVVGMAVIRAPHIRRSIGVKVLSKRNTVLDNVLVALVSLGLFLPLVWIVTPVLKFADYSLWAIPFACGVICLVVGLWFLHRTHVDLGTNWSNTLELREGHRLVTGGIYRQV